MTPNDVDLSGDLKSTFGMMEYEEAMCGIVRYLQDDKAQPDLPSWLGEVGTGWEKKFRINTIGGINPALFAMMCSAGWIDAGYFPKYTFTVSKAAIERLAERAGK